MCVCVCIFVVNTRLHCSDQSDSAALFLHVHKVHSTPKLVPLRETHYTQLLTKHLSNSANSTSPSLKQHTASLQHHLSLNPPRALYPHSNQSFIILHLAFPFFFLFLLRNTVFTSSQEKNEQFPCFSSLSCKKKIEIIVQ